jgi:hypothetical protein
MRITKKDALVSTRIKFVKTRSEVMNKRNITKDFGGNREGTFLGKIISKGDFTFENTRGHCQKICGSNNCICKKSLGTFIWSIRAQAIARMGSFFHSAMPFC